MALILADLGAPRRHWAARGWWEWLEAQGWEAAGRCRARSICATEVVVLSQQPPCPQRPCPRGGPCHAIFAVFMGNFPLWFGRPGLDGAWRWGEEVLVCLPPPSLGDNVLEQCRSAALWPVRSVAG